MKARTTLSEEQLRHYDRAIIVDEIGISGQEKLLASRVLVVGAGGLGAACLSYLTAAGIGHIGIIDDDRVERSNLSRQIIHEQADIGRAKVDSARDRLEELNSDTQITTNDERLSESNAASLFADYDIIVDGSDNFATRFAVNAACIAKKKPLVSAAIRGFEGQLSTFKGYRNDQPCYQCFVPEQPPEENNCSGGGVLGPLAGVMGSMQAVETIKELLGIGESLSGRVLRYDGLAGHWLESKLTKLETCERCGSELRQQKTG